MKRNVSVLLTVLLLAAIVMPAAARGAQEAVEEEKTLEILWRIGGSGEYIQPAVDKFKELYPDVKVSVEYSPEAHTILRPKFVAGNPPDIFQVNVGFFDFFGAIQEGAMQPINDVLDMTPVGETITIGEKLNRDLLDVLTVDGDFYILSDNMFIASMFYDQTLFNEKGWEVPVTWGEFVALCERIKAEEPNIAPFVYPGQFQYYLLHSFFFSIVGDIGGLQALKDMNNLEPGFYNSDVFLEAVKRIAYMRDRGFFIDGLMALNHTQAQMEFINGRAAMLASGSWVYNEMMGNWPDNFELTPMFPPVRTNHDDAGFMRVSNSYVGIPRDAKSPDMAKEFIRVLFSEDVRKQLIEKYSTFLPVKNLTVGVEHLMHPSVKASYDLLDASNNFAYITPIQIWHAPFYSYLQEQLASMIMGRITPEQMCQNVETNAGQRRNDPNVVMYRLE